MPELANAYSKPRIKTLYLKSWICSKLIIKTKENNFSLSTSIIVRKNYVLLFQTLSKHLSVRKLVKTILFLFYFLIKLLKTCQNILLWTMFSHIETCQLICRANQLAGFYISGTLVVKELTNFTRMLPKFSGCL